MILEKIPKSIHSCIYKLQYPKYKDKDFKYNIKPQKIIYYFRKTKNEHYHASNRLYINTVQKMAQL